MKPTPDADDLKEARIRATQLAASFVTVFGIAPRRTAAQQRVLEHLAKCAGDDQNSYRFHEAKDGLALVAAGLHRDGARSLLRVIDRQLELAALAARPPPEKHKIRK